MKKFLAIVFACVLFAPAAVEAADINYGASRHIGDEELEAKDPMMATVFSILPGLVFHGSGNFYAGDYDFGSRMLIMEILGGGLALWGHNIIHQPNHWGRYFGGDTDQAGYWIKAAGVGMLVISWIGDLATAPGAATSWNNDHQLQLQMDSYDGTGARIALASHF